MKKTWCAVLVALSLTTASAARADSGVRSDWAGFGLGVAAVAINTVYVPVKICYAGFGGLFGAIALGVTGGNMKAADEIWGSMMGGDYVVTTDMLKGKEGLSFIGDHFGEPETPVERPARIREERL